MATETENKSGKLDKARQVNEDRNKTRLELLNSIADGSDESVADQMRETDDGNIVLDEPVNKLEVGKTEVEEPVVATTETTEAVEGDEVVETTTDEPVVVATTTQADEEEEEELPTDERVVNGTRYYLTIVNGTEKWLTKHQLIERAQKVESADDYLKTAAEAVRSVARPDLSVTDDAGNVEEEDVDMEKTLSSAVLGDQEAVKKIASTFSALRADLRKAQKAQPSVTPDVVKEIDSRMAFRNAVDWFEGEFSKELSDPNLKELIYARDKKLSEESPEMPYKQRLKAAGDGVRNWINGQKGVQAKPSTDKTERKKTIVNVPTASQRQAVTTEEDEEESVESVIQKMAQARKQPRAIVHRGPLTK